MHKLLLAKIPPHSIIRKSLLAILRIRYRLFHAIDYERSVTRLRALEKDIQDANGFFDVPFTYRGYGEFKRIAPRQIVSEIKTLYELVQNLQPQYVGEIGTFQGGTFYLWCKAAQDGAMLLSLDLPGGPFGGGYSPGRLKFYEQFARPQQTLHFLQVNSHLAGTAHLVKEKLAGHLLDFLFIDGDHTYAGVKRDFELYKPFVRPKGMIALHDILPRPDIPTIEVNKFWDEIKTGYIHQEIIAPHKPQIGIGVIWTD